MDSYLEVMDLTAVWQQHLAISMVRLLLMAKVLWLTQQVVFPMMNPAKRLAKYELAVTGFYQEVMLTILAT
tara:strand:+ start:197 stop:409 length:213 start_codon:yes stop_codon:yes gene_type:complete